MGKAHSWPADGREGLACPPAWSAAGIPGRRSVATGTGREGNPPVAFTAATVSGVGVGVGASVDVSVGVGSGTNRDGRGGRGTRGGSACDSGGGEVAPG